VEARTRGIGTQAAASGEGLAHRLRQLRLAAGLTQTELAGGRCSKEYVSQIERGKTRPTRETLEWLAVRLGVDPDYLAAGISAGERARLESALARAEALNHGHRYDDAIAELRRIRGAAAGAAPELELRALVGEAWARVGHGDVDRALAVLAEARALAESPAANDADRADVLFWLGVCRYKLSSISTAIALFDEALALAERSELATDVLRANILGWRSRCYRRQRDWLAAREDVERALELAVSARDARTAAEAYFQASIVAERQGQWVLARSHAERAKALYEDLADRENVGRLLNNLGGLTYLLGKPEEAVGHLKEAFGIALDLGHDADAGQVVSSLAEVELGTGNHAAAEEHARHALELLGGRVDYLHEIGTAQLTLGRALLAQDRLAEAEGFFRAADNSFEQLASASHRAAAWVALGDLAARRGDDRESARWFRRAAEALQDYRF
jgi:tetratricopeptide (TPR) repeat protein